MNVHDELDRLREVRDAKKRELDKVTKALPKGLYTIHDEHKSKEYYDKVPSPPKNIEEMWVNQLKEELNLLQEKYNSFNSSLEQRTSFIDELKEKVSKL